jgi:integrase
VRLTKRLVEATMPGIKDTIIWDSELKGFGLKLTPSGRRNYFLYYRTASGQQRRPAIGTHGELTVEQARQIAKQWLARVALGEDVSRDRMSSRKADSVSMLAERYLNDHAALHKKPRSIATDRANLENHVIPLIGRLKVDDVTRTDIERLHVAVRDGKTARQLRARPRGRRIIRGGPGIANRVLALVSKMFACAEAWDLRDTNPARGIKKFRERRKDRFLDQDEIARLLAALDDADQLQIESRFATAAIRLLLFTGMRSGEVTSLRWSAYDRPRQCLRLVDSKVGERTIPLSTHAVAILEGLAEGKAGDLIFPGANGVSAIALTRPWYRVRAAAHIDQTANLHSLRHTLASWSVMGGLSLAQVGAVLGHRNAQTTLRYADHRVDALRSYAQQVGDTFSAMSNQGATNEAPDQE